MNEQALEELRSLLFRRAVALELQAKNAKQSGDQVLELGTFAAIYEVLAIANHFNLQMPISLPGLTYENYPTNRRG